MVRSWFCSISLYNTISEPGLLSALAGFLSRFSIRMYRLITNTHAGKMSEKYILKLMTNSIATASG